MHIFPHTKKTSSTNLGNTFLNISNFKGINTFEFTLSYYKHYFMIYLNKMVRKCVRPLAWIESAKIILFLYFESIVSPKVVLLNYYVIDSQRNAFAELKLIIK